MADVVKWRSKHKVEMYSNKKVNNIQVIKVIKASITQLIATLGTKILIRMF